MLTLAESPVIRSVKPIETPDEFREALERLRRIEVADADSPRGRERADLEIEICRYLAGCEQRTR